ncbi:hypothetical protein H0H93_011621 [Arthromyces matolae]|nr:hypothetical protein H0H93_011621 [Arthromyces matolae]
MEVIAQFKSTSPSEILKPTVAAFLPLLEANRSTIEEIPSKTFQYGPTARHQLDVYYPLTPSSGGKTRVLLWTYGGGFTSGDRRLPPPTDIAYANVGSFFARRGFIVVIADYRLAPGTNYPGAAEDIRDVALWVTKNAEKLITPATPEPDVEKIFMMGHSGGAVWIFTALALPGNESEELRSHVAGLILHAGALDYELLDKNHFFYTTVVTPLYGGVDSVEVSVPTGLLRNASDGLVATLPRTLLVIGEKDMDWMIKGTDDFAEIFEARKGEKAAKIRKNDALEDTREPKRRQLPPAAHYVERGGQLESANLEVVGEDPFEHDDDPTAKPVRVLSDFVIYDPKHRNEMILLSSIEEEDGVAREFEAEGLVSPYYQNDEDEGQEDDDASDSGNIARQPKMVRLGAIMRYTFDPTETDGKVYIETEFAWYILDAPFSGYTALYQHFFTPLQISQLIITAVLKSPRLRYDEFIQRFVTKVDPFGRTYQEKHLLEVLPNIRDAINECEEYDRLKDNPLIRHILAKSSAAKPRIRRKHALSTRGKPPPITALTGNLDIALLARENAVPTHVTPLIASLAQGLVSEELVVTMMEELGHPQELFWNEICENVPWGAVIDKIVVHENSKPPGSFDEYFVKFVYDIPTARYVSTNAERRDLFAANPAPDNCFTCAILDQRDQECTENRLRDDTEHVNGVSFRGQKYHYEDFVLYRAKQGPAHLGYIVNFRIISNTKVQSERHVYLTDEVATVPLKDLIRVCHVFNPKSFNSKEQFKNWLAISPYHFYIKYSFPSISVTTWAQRKSLLPTDLHVCMPCTQSALEELKDMEEFLEDAEDHPFKTLDIFGGVGAFSMGLEEGSRCMEVTDIVELAPSAAKTVLRNFPNVTVHNRCANEVLRYAIKEKMGQRPDPLQQHYDQSKYLSPLEWPDVIVAGVPCQTHSRLNQYKRAGDKKSNLILTALSFVDHFRPKYFYFENVPGFKEFTFDAVQATEHTVEGGIPMGGLKFVVRALIEMQSVHFSGDLFDPHDRH